MLRERKDAEMKASRQDAERGLIALPKGTVKEVSGVESV
jgi:hypothetical protein